jgi:cation diffusion facilitator family transporter
VTRIAGSSIGVSMVVLGLKAAAWWLSDSAALFSDALESVVNVATAVMAFAALSLSAKPADDNHPYGHHKIEFFAAVIEGALIIAASVIIMQQAWVTWLHPVPVRAPDRAIAVSLLATLINAGWAFTLWRTGRRLRSPSLDAEARHLAGDVFTSVVLVIGVALVAWTGITRLDPALAAAAAIAVLCSGYVVVRDSVGGLMDEAPGPEIVERIRLLVEQYAEGALEVHDLRTRHAGRMTFLEFHLVVPGAMTVAAAHVICDRIEEGLKLEMEGVRTTIHVEPEGKAKHHGVLAL